MYYNPRIPWYDSWLASTAAGENAFADVYKVEGLRGIYIANQIRSESINKGSIEPEDLVSLITFDQGGTWANIKGPKTDDEGRNFSTCKSDPCTLHVAQKLSKSFPSAR